MAIEANPNDNAYRHHLQSSAGLNIRGSVGCDTEPPDHRAPRPERPMPQETTR
jgi:hypothetical protein